MKCATGIIFRYDLNVNFQALHFFLAHDKVCIIYVVSESQFQIKIRAGSSIVGTCQMSHFVSSVNTITFPIKPQEFFKNNGIIFGSAIFTLCYQPEPSNSSPDFWDLWARNRREHNNSLCGRLKSIKFLWPLIKQRIFTHSFRFESTQGINNFRVH